jgi:phosphate-selective porin OprO/OprP
MVLRVSRRVLWGVAAVMLGLASRTDAAKDLDDILHDKGLLSDDEYEALQPNTALTYKPTVRVGGRFMIDAATYDSDEVDLSSGTEVRRARLFAKGKIGPDWFYKAQYEFTSSGLDGIRDLYLGYSGLTPNTVLRIGHFVEYGSLEDTTSSRYTTFMERATPILMFQPANRRIGIGADTHGGAWYAGAGVFGENTAIDESEDDGIGTSIRSSCAPLNKEGRVLHAGLFGQWRQPGGDVVRYQARPESHVSDFRILDTLAISNVNDTITYGFEAACVVGPFSVQGEYMGVEIRRNEFPDEAYDGFYVFGSWFITGESRPYDSKYGVFERVHPKHNAGDGGFGAWELALRFSTIDIDGDVYNGGSDGVTLGLNWYTNPYIRFMLNVGRSDVSSVDQDLEIDTVQMRAQVDF